MSEFWTQSPPPCPSPTLGGGNAASRTKALPPAWGRVGWEGNTALALLIVIACLFTAPAHAIFTEQPLSDPTQEARAQELMKELRCLVCQNQAISESHAPLARDLRVVLRERIAAGDSDSEALDFMVQRFGDWVLLSPPFKMNTLILWLGPLLILIPGLVICFIYLRRRGSATKVQASGTAALDPSEQVELQRALSDER